MVEKPEERKRPEPEEPSEEQIEAEALEAELRFQRELEEQARRIAEIWKNRRVRATVTLTTAYYVGLYQSYQGHPSGGWMRARRPPDATPVETRPKSTSVGTEAKQAGACRGKPRVDCTSRDSAYHQ